MYLWAARMWARKDPTKKLEALIKQERKAKQEREVFEKKLRFELSKQTKITQ
jgi:hypothetical protein